MAAQPLIAPSILSADLARLGEQIAEVEAAGADWIHIDVMDGRFVPPISFGQVLVAACRRATRLPLDVHLMVQEPEGMLASFAEAGADHIHIHFEASSPVERSLQAIRDLGCKAGLALNPATPAAAVGELLPLLDIVLVMSVNPGYSGQAFIPAALPKATTIREMLDAAGGRALIEIDGGIDAGTLPAAQAAGVGVFVAGNAIYQHPGGVAAGVAALQQAAAQPVSP
ncbi:MAG: ribulose-phosphate 3-epimerase [Anaerolineales bacterium]|nr:ribulose-phosphate 3-epimerase [Anaerolineales bacterium]